MKYPQPAKQAAAYAYNAFDALATAVIGTEGSNTINAAVQLKDARGNAVARVCHVRAYLSDLSTGLAITATATTSALAIGTNGAILQIPVTGKMVDIVTDASGRFDLNIIQTAAPVTYYLVICLPNGGIQVLGPVTFA